MRAIVTFIFLLSLIGPGVARARDSAFLYTNPLSFEADIIPRYPGIGEDEARKLRFVSWYALNGRAQIGLTEDGEVFGSVTVQQARSWRPNFKPKLSPIFFPANARSVKFPLDSSQRLTAIDTDGQNPRL